MADHVEWVEATDPIAGILPGEDLPDGTVSDEYAIRIAGGGGATIVIKGNPQDFAVFATSMAQTLSELAAHSWGR
jgi:hypothetical protein